ncbi:UNKNOWN [Stylonychia lemnae]|uniref:AB hydrolase-1 domain-containing protein n=1 Tax=Stylonychia lemnae TaxID=5949 RepID=A0A077ZWP7_STYLE|nr:UNKNOWN [Stylonychia lemnae]|eukprot:CDW72916.1 UNKNOWN [Stylonychia lemnae]
MHGLFGNAKTSRFLAQNKQSMATDLKSYLDYHQIGRAVLVGQSMGGKVAMTFASLFQDQVEGIISIDSPPIDRNQYPEMNHATNNLIKRALQLNFSSMSYKQAVEYINKELFDERAFASSLAMCLDRDSQEQAKLKLNLKAFDKNKSNLYGYEAYGQFRGPCLMINGRQSFQYEIENDVKFYQHVFPEIKQQDIIILENAGHWVHAERKDEVIKLISDFIESLDNSNLSN